VNPQGSKWLGRLTRTRIYVRDGGVCVACGRGPGDCKVHRNPLTRCPGLSLDHVRRPADGGARRDPRNLLTLCCQCNTSRRSQPIAAWRPELVAVVRKHTRRAVFFSRPAADRARFAAAVALARELWPRWAEREASRERGPRGSSILFDFGFSSRSAA